MAPSFTIIDDRDLSVTYTGVWSVGGTSHENAGTVSSSLTVGDHFSVPFTGAGISVYGTFDASSDGVQTSYAIDGGPATTVTSPSSGKDSFQKLFWQSGAVPSGPHNLVVTMVTVNNVGDGEGTVWFDYFNVTSEAISSVSQSLTAGSSTSASSSSTSSPSPSTTAVVTPAKKTSSALIGGVIAAIVVVLIIIGAILFWRRKRRAKQYFPDNNLSSIQPFLPDQTATIPMSGLPGSAPVLVAPYGNPASSSGKRPRPAQPSHVSSASAASGSSSQHKSRGTVASVGGSSTAGPSHSHSSSSSVADLKRQQQQAVNSHGQRDDEPPIVQHVDSGVRELDPVSAGTGRVELPPVYTPT
ncbi:hypothetical protein B0H19DRAFT_1151699 [Mycena capillaripes]|nr:hypothetical protein B0H19DRAFT_1151699 [Mycena capillaripes]